MSDRIDLCRPPRKESADVTLEQFGGDWAQLIAAVERMSDILKVYADTPEHIQQFCAALEQHGQYLRPHDIWQFYLWDGKEWRTYGEPHSYPMPGG